MQFAHVRHTFLPLLSLAALAVSSAGGCCCFTAVYDIRAYETWEKLERGLNETPPAPTQVRGDERTIEEQTGITIRLPRLFDRKEMGMPLMPNISIGGQLVPPNRIQPPDLDLPGYYITYEMFYSDQPQRKLPVYCYLGALPKDASLREVRQEILDQLKEKHPDAAWAEKNLESGEKADYLFVAGNEKFYPKDRPVAVEVPGQMAIYVVKKDHAVVVAAWRAPAEIAQRVSLFRAAEASVASIQSDQPKPIAEAADPLPETADVE